MISALRRIVSELVTDDEGATAMEYGLIAAAIAGVIMTVVYVLGGKLNNIHQPRRRHINVRAPRAGLYARGWKRS